MKHLRTDLQAEYSLSFIYIIFYIYYLLYYMCAFLFCLIVFILFVFFMCVRVRVRACSSKLLTSLDIETP